MTTEGQVQELERRLESDQTLERRLEQDTVGTLQAEGFPEMAAEAQQAQDRGNKLVRRIESDPTFWERFREDLRNDPVGALVAQGIPMLYAEPFLRAIQAPPELIEKASPDVTGHHHRWYHRNWGGAARGVGKVGLKGLGWPYTVYDALKNPAVAY